MIDCDVLIAGAGPAGMATALSAHAAGLSVRLIEKHAQRLSFSRAILVNPATIALLAPFGVSDAIIARGRRLTGMSMRDFDGPLIEATLEHVPGHPPAMLLPQLDTEAAMEAALAARGIAIERPVELIDFSENAEQITATLEAPGGAQNVRARYLAGADGYHSAVRRAAGIGFSGSDLPERLDSIDVEMDWPYAQEVCIWPVPGGGLGAIRLPGDGVRFAGIDLDRIALIRDMPKPHKTLWSATFDVHFKHVESYGRGRVWLAGDAAHVHSPLGGRGMNMGIADGIALGSALATGRLEAFSAAQSTISTAWVRQNRIFSNFMLSTAPGTNLGLSAMRIGLQAVHALGGDQRLGNLVVRQVAGV